MVATKNYLIDSFADGLAIKAPCLAVSTANLTLSGEQTVNGVALVADDRCLVAAQTDPVENGIYNVSTSDWTRAQDFDGNRDAVEGTLVTVIASGLSQFYKLSTASPVVVGTSQITWTLLGELTEQAFPKWTAQAADFELGANDKVIVTATSADIDVTLQASGLLLGHEMVLHVDAASTFDAIIAPGSYTIRGPQATVTAPDTLTIAAGETVYLVFDGTSELEIV